MSTGTPGVCAEFSEYGDCKMFRWIAPDGSTAFEIKLNNTNKLEFNGKYIDTLKAEYAEKLAKSSPDSAFRNCSEEEYIRNYLPHIDRIRIRQGVLDLDSAGPLHGGSIKVPLKSELVLMGELL